MVKWYENGDVPTKCPCGSKGKKKPFIYPAVGGCICGSCKRLLRSYHWKKEPDKPREKK